MMTDTADASMTALAFGQVGDHMLSVHFELVALPDEELSLKAGYTVSKEEECIYIRAPGSRDFVLRKASNRDRRRFPSQYRHFKESQSAPDVGMPLKDWAPIARSEVDRYAYHGVKTVEQLAMVSDSNLDRLGMGAASLRQKARDMLEQAKGLAPIEGMRAENAQLKSQLDALQRMMEQLQASQVAAAQEEASETPKAQRKRNA